MNAWFKNGVFLLLIGLSFASHSQTIFPARQNKLWGYIDTSGTWIIKPMFDLASPIGANGYARVVANNQVGMVSSSGKLVFKNHFKKIVIVNDSILTFTNGNGWGLCLFDGTILLPDTFDYFYEFGSYGAIVIQKGKLHGLCNQKGEIVLPIVYESIKHQKGNLGAIQTTKNGLLGLHWANGKELLDHRYNQITLADTNFIVAGNKDFIGCLDSTGEEKIPFEYANFTQCNSNVSIWSNRKGNYLYNHLAWNIIHEKAEQYFLFDDERIGAIIKENYGVLNNQGDFIIEPKYNQISFNNSYFRVGLNNAIGLFDYNGQSIVPCEFNYVGFPQDSIIPVFYQDKWGAYFVGSGKIVDTIYNRINILERQIKASNNKSVSIIDIGAKGKIISKDVYEQVYFFNIVGGAKRGFNSDTARVNVSRPNFYFQDKETKLWGLRNPKGEVVIKPIFLKLRHFDGFTVGYLRAGSNRALSTGQIQMGASNLCGIIDDRNFKMIVPPNLTYIDEQDFSDTTKLIVRAIGLSSRFVTFNKKNHKIKQYNAIWMDPLSDDGLTRIYVGGVLSNTYKSDINAIGSINEIAWRLNLVLPSSKTSRTVLNSWVVCRGGYWNYIDSLGDYLLDEKNWREKDRFSEAFAFYKGTAIVKRNNKLGIINNKGEFTVQTQYDGISRIAGTDLLVLHTNDKAFGYTDEFGNIIGELAYNQVQEFSHGKAWVLKGDQWMLLSENGTISTNPEMIRFRTYVKGWAPIKTNDKQWAFWDGNQTTWKMGNLQNLGSLNDGLAKYKLYGKYGFLNDNGIKVVQPIFTQVGDFEKGFSWVKNRKGKMAVINKELKIITPYKYKKINNYDNAQQVIVKKMRYGLLNSNGKSILPCHFKSISTIQCGRRIAHKGNTLIVLDEKGKVVKKLKNVKKASPYSDGLCKVLKGRNYGYLDTNGNWALQPVYKSCTDFNDGVALVGPVISRYIINRYGDTMCQSPIKARHAFSQGVTIATNYSNGLQYYVSTLGINEFELNYFNIKPFQGSNVSIVNQRDYNFGMVHSTGIEVFRPIMPYIGEPKDNKCKVTMHVKSEVVRPNGEVIVPLGYMDLTSIETHKIIKVNGIGSSFGYLRFDGSWLYKEM